MKIFRKWILVVSGAVAVLGGCALPGLDDSHFAVQAGGELALAKQYEQQGELEMARQVYEGLIESTPDHAAPYHRLGILAAKQGDFAGADQYFRRAHALDPGNVNLLNDAGYAYYLQGRLAEAEEFLKLALTREPHNARAQNNLGIVLGRQGKVAESLAVFRQVVPEAEAYANLAHATEHATDDASHSGMYRSGAAVDGGGFERVLASRLARRSEPRIEAGTRSPAGTFRQIEPPRGRRIEAEGTTVNGPVAPVAHQVGQQQQGIVENPTAVGRPSSELASRARRAKPRRAHEARVRTPRLFEGPRGARGDWAVDGSLKSAGVGGRRFRSAAERAGERLQRKPSPPEATLSAAVQSARRTASRADAVARVRTPRLFSSPAARPSHVNRMQGRTSAGSAERVRTSRPTANTADRQSAATDSQSKRSDSGPEIVYLNRTSAQESAEAPRAGILFGPPPSASGKQSAASGSGPEVVYLNRSSAKQQKQTPRVKVLFGPETRGE